MAVGSVAAGSAVAGSVAAGSPVLDRPQHQRSRHAPLPALRQYTHVVDAARTVVVVRGWPGVGSAITEIPVVGRDAAVQINPYKFFKNDWILIGSYATCYSFQPAIAWLANGVIDTNPLVSHSVPMADFATAFDQFAQGKTLKVQVQIS